MFYLYFFFFLQKLLYVLASPISLWSSSWEWSERLFSRLKSSENLPKRSLCVCVFPQSTSLSMLCQSGFGHHFSPSYFNNACLDENHNISSIHLSELKDFFFLTCLRDTGSFRFPLIVSKMFWPCYKNLWYKLMRDIFWRSSLHRKFRSLHRAYLYEADAGEMLRI